MRAGREGTCPLHAFKLVQGLYLSPKESVPAGLGVLWTSASPAQVKSSPISVTTASLTPRRHISAPFFKAPEGVGATTGRQGDGVPGQEMSFSGFQPHSAQCIVLRNSLLSCMINFDPMAGNTGSSLATFSVFRCAATCNLSSRCSIVRSSFFFTNVRVFVQVQDAGASLDGGWSNGRATCVQ